MLPSPGHVSAPGYRERAGRHGETGTVDKSWYRGNRNAASGNREQSNTGLKERTDGVTGTLTRFNSEITSDFEALTL